MTRHRPRPRRRQAAQSRLAPCVYVPDPGLPDPVTPGQHLCRCGLPHRHPRHALPDTADAQDAHRRRIGDQ